MPEEEETVDAVVEGDRLNEETKEKEYLINYGSVQAWLSESSLGEGEQALVEANTRKQKKKGGKKKTPKGKKRRSTLSTRKTRKRSTRALLPALSPGETPSKRPKLEPNADFLRPELSRSRVLRSTTKRERASSSSPPKKPIKPESASDNDDKENTSNRLNMSITDPLGATRDLVVDSATGALIIATPTPPKKPSTPSVPLNPAVSPSDTNSRAKNNASADALSHSFPPLLSANALNLSSQSNLAPPPPLESDVETSFSGGPPPLERPKSGKRRFKSPASLKAKGTRKDAISVVHRITNAKTPPRLIKAEPKSPLASHFVRFPDENSLDVKPDIKPDIKPIIKREVKREYKTPMVLRSMGKADKYAPLFSRESMSINKTSHRKRRREAARKRRESNPVEAAAKAAAAVNLSDIESPPRKRPRTRRSKREAAKAATTSKKRRRGAIDATTLNKRSKVKSEPIEAPRADRDGRKVEDDSIEPRDAHATSPQASDDFDADPRSPGKPKADLPLPPLESADDSLCKARNADNGQNYERNDEDSKAEDERKLDGSNEAGNESFAPPTPYTGRIPDTPVSVLSDDSSLPATPVLGSRWLHENVRAPLAPAFVDLTLNDDESDDDDVQIIGASDFHSPRPLVRFIPHSEPPLRGGSEVFIDLTGSAPSPRVESEPQGISELDGRPLARGEGDRLNRELQGEFDMERSNAQGDDCEIKVQVERENASRGNNREQPPTHVLVRSISDSGDHEPCDVYAEMNLDAKEMTARGMELTLLDIPNATRRKLVLTSLVSFLMISTVMNYALSTVDNRTARIEESQAKVWLTIASCSFGAHALSHALFLHCFKGIGSGVARIVEDLVHLSSMASIAICLTASTQWHHANLGPVHYSVLLAILCGHSLRALLSNCLTQRSIHRLFRDTFRTSLCLMPFVRVATGSGLLSMNAPQAQLSFLPSNARVLRTLAAGLSVQLCLIFWRIVYPQLRSKNRSHRVSSNPFAGFVLGTISTHFVTSTRKTPWELVHNSGNHQNFATSLAGFSWLLMAVFVFSVVLLLCLAVSSCRRFRRRSFFAVFAFIISSTVVVLYVLLSTCSTTNAASPFDLAREFVSYAVAPYVKHRDSREPRSLSLLVLSDAIVSGLHT